MRAFACAFIASVALAAVPAAAALPRAASLNLCTDELLLLLAHPAQVASVTHLSQSVAETSLWRVARRFPKNDGSLLSIVPTGAELVLTTGGAGRDTMGIARRLGLRVIDLPFPQRLDDVDRAIGEVARALGRPAQGHALRARIAALRRTRPQIARDTIWLGGGGRSLAPDGLGAEWMALAGLRQRPLPGDRASLETLLVRPPALLLRSAYRAGEMSGEQRWLRHPLARRVRARTITTDGRAWTCMGPLLTGEILRLRRAVTS